jgi:hypothetical protein
MAVERNIDVNNSDPMHRSNVSRHKAEQSLWGKTKRIASRTPDDVASACVCHDQWEVDAYSVSCFRSYQ